MKTTIWGDILPAVTIDLEQGESIYTESGGMTWMSDKVKMDTNMKGGFMKGLGRMFSGESLFWLHTPPRPRTNLSQSPHLFPEKSKNFTFLPTKNLFVKNQLFCVPSKMLNFQHM